MKVYPVCSNYYRNNQPKCHSKIQSKQVTFTGKHDCAKWLAAICTGVGTVGAIGGALMTGGISIIPTLAYGAFCGSIGAIGGHIIDKSQPDYDKK